MKFLAAKWLLVRSFTSLLTPFHDLQSAPENSGPCHYLAIKWSCPTNRKAPEQHPHSVYWKQKSNNFSAMHPHPCKTSVEGKADVIQTNPSTPFPLPFGWVFRLHVEQPGPGIPELQARRARNVALPPRGRR